MTAFFLLLFIVFFVNLMEDAEREHNEFMAEMDAWRERMRR